MHRNAPFLSRSCQCAAIKTDWGTLFKSYRGRCSDTILYERNLTVYFSHEKTRRREEDSVPTLFERSLKDCPNGPQRRRC